MSKSDILRVVTGILLTFFLFGHEDQSEFSTLPIQPLTEIVAVGNNQTIGILLDSVERRAIGTGGMTKPRHAAPPMPRSYPIKSPPKPKPTKK